MCGRSPEIQWDGYETKLPRSGPGASLQWLLGCLWLQRDEGIPVNISQLSDFFDMPLKLSFPNHPKSKNQINHA